MENTFSRASFRYLLVQFQRADSFSPTKNVLPFQVLRVATGLYSYKTVDES